MFWITKNRHIKIVDHYKEVIDDLRGDLKQKEKIEEILDRLVDKTSGLTARFDSFAVGSSFMACLDDTVPVYVDDYFGGKVIKQEATPVTILDEKGKATYGLTKGSADKGKKYKLVQN